MVSDRSLVQRPALKVHLNADILCWSSVIVSYHHRMWRLIAIMCSLLLHTIIIIIIIIISSSSSCVTIVNIVGTQIISDWVKFICLSYA